MVLVSRAKILIVLVTCSVISASPTGKLAFWKGTPFDSSIEEMRSMCAEDDPIACLKFKAISFLDSILQKDFYQISDNVEVSRNSYNDVTSTSRSERSIEDTVEDYIKKHDVTVKLPIGDSKITLDARNLETDEINLKINYGGEVQARGKSKLKKIMIPILVFVLLKAMTLVPLAIGILGLKAWNAVQLSFFSFIIAVGLAIFQLCKKIAAEHSPPQIAAHSAWEPAYSHFPAKRSFGEESSATVDVNKAAQNLAYSAYNSQ